MTRQVAILGLGYVGLPLVSACVASGHRVVGFDVDAERVDLLNRANSYVDDISDERIAGLLNDGFLASTDPDVLAGSDVFIICVPTPLTPSGGPDLAAVEAATHLIAGNLGERCLVILESTTYPGTTEEIVKPILEQGGLRAGADFALAFSPERIDPGNTKFSFRSTPKVVGGLTRRCTKAVTDFYRDMVDEVVVVKGLREAEMTKLLENTYRHVNIALVNELTKICRSLSIDFWDVIRAAESKPYGFQAFRPGPGVGGHCIPIDPNYLSHRVRSELGQSFRFVELAQEINRSMPAYVLQRIQEILNRDAIALRGAKILILGVTYKKDIADTRESPAYEVTRLLRHQGAEIRYHDQYVNEWSVDGVEVERITDLTRESASSDCVVLLQDHEEYLLHPERITCTRLLDTRGVLATSPPSSQVMREAL